MLLSRFIKERIDMPLTLITIFEDRQQKLTLTQAQMDDILSFREIIGQNNVRLDYDGTLQIMHYVGFISKGKTRLQILPKIYENTLLDTEKEQRESMNVMLNLLRVSYQRMSVCQLLQYNWFYDIV